MRVPHFFRLSDESLKLTLLGAEIGQGLRRGFPVVGPLAWCQAEELADQIGRALVDPFADRLCAVAL